LRNIISSDIRTGNCDFCKSNAVSIYRPSELIPYFENIFSLYTPNMNSNFNIESALDKDFENNIFSEKVINKLSLIKSIIEDKPELTGLTEGNVISRLWESKHIKETDIIHSKWEMFKEEIKNTNRFHIQSTINLEKLKEIFENESFKTELKKGRKFFRSRISDSNGINIQNMGNPPNDKASSGRANPRGISYLYLADKIETSIYESRASLFDYVTVGEFKLNQNINILNLRKPDNDPIIWAEAEAIDDYLTYIPFIKTLQMELSLPIRKVDKEIDYLPTQYLSEYIKSIGIYDGVEFQSSLDPNGYNLAIFYPYKFECINTKVYEIDSINIKFNEVVKNVKTPS
jgi:hypothetical protein